MHRNSRNLLAMPAPLSGFLRRSGGDFKIRHTRESGYPIVTNAVHEFQDKWDARVKPGHDVKGLE